MTYTLRHPDARRRLAAAPADSLAARYRYARSSTSDPLRYPAASALAAARKDSARRYSTRCAPMYAGEADALGARWISHAADNLRLAGYAEAEPRGWHSGLIQDRRRAGGWYTNTFQSGTYVAAVFQLRGSRPGVTCYVPGYVETESGDDGARVNFRDRYETAPGEDGRESRALRECIRAARRMAERDAEESREHCAASVAGQQYADTLAESTETRSKGAELIREIRKAGEFSPAICAALRDSLTGYARTLEKLRRKRKKLLAGEIAPRDGEWWNPHRAKFRETFADAAGLPAPRLFPNHNARRGA